MERISIRRDLFLFLRQPDYETMQDLTVKSKFLILFKLFILTYLGLIIVSIPLAILQKTEIMGEVTQKTQFIYETIKIDFAGFRPYFLVSVILIVPILEELSFRLALDNYNNKFLVISVSVFLGMFLGDYLSQSLWLPNSYLAYFLIYYIYIVLASGVLYLIIRTDFVKRKFDRIKTVWNTKPGLIFYLIAVFFAILHINNLEIKTNDLIFIPLIILPFFVGGLSLGYLRVRLGIKYSIILHVIINGLAFGLLDLIKH
jgi:hypothetical protein